MPVKTSRNTDETIALSLPAIFQNNMMLQREKPVPVWGQSAPGAKITVSVQGQTACTTADADSSWKVTLSPLTASDEETLAVTAFAPGIEADNNPTDKTGPDTKTILFKNVAVGEIWVAAGQSNMEFWMRYEKHRSDALINCPGHRIRFFDVPKICFDRQLADFDYSRMGIWRFADTKESLDYFSAVGFYFQKELEEALNVPVGIIGCNWGGTVSAAWMHPDTVKRVGKPWMDHFHEVPEYANLDQYLAAQHTKRINDHGNPFSDVFLEKVLPQTLPDREFRQFVHHLPRDFYRDCFYDYFEKPQPQSIPGSLYQHMLKTIAPCAVRGILWYQGEGDDEFGFADLYQEMLTALIGDWRALWEDPALPFLIVQLPGFSRWLMQMPGNNFMEIRRCQEAVCDTVPGTWLCSISDSGEEADAHPKDKKTVGHRLALLALGHIYGKNLLSDAPRAVSSLRRDTLLIVTFAHAEGGLVICGDRLEAMQLFDSTGREMAFDAAAEGEQLILTMKNLTPGPIKIAFAQTSWYRVNLYNQAGIPAVPFIMSA
ncbi:MAG: hypothetical protein LUC83_09890 [Clostridiales bacterium]|nr:hypothetical protein [Clostridiales bacterium]